MRDKATYDDKLGHVQFTTCRKRSAPSASNLSKNVVRTKVTERILQLVNKLDEVLIHGGPGSRAYRAEEGSGIAVKRQTRLNWSD